MSLTLTRVRLDYAAYKAAVRVRVKRGGARVRVRDADHRYLSIYGKTRLSKQEFKVMVMVMVRVRVRVKTRLSKHGGRHLQGRHECP
jgi:hypothetical protein